MPRSSGVLDWTIADTPLAILDFETTGLSAGADRVVEVSVIRAEPGQPFNLMLDTLVNPDRQMAATEIHGITDEDVVDAPRFGEIANDVVRSLSGCVVAAYNVYFDLRFLEYELQNVGLAKPVPHLCLMYMRPMMGLGGRCSLEDACCAHGVEHSQKHRTAADALAASRLWSVYLEVLRARRIRTFGELASLKRYKFVDSLQQAPLAISAVRGAQRAAHLKPRGAAAVLEVSAGPRRAQRVTREDARHAYWEALKAVICDLDVTGEEMACLNEKKRELRLTTDELRSLHARAFASMISFCVKDHLLEENECLMLRQLHQCLSKLGWAPGD